MTNVVRFQ